MTTHSVAARTCNSWLSRGLGLMFRDVEPTALTTKKPQPVSIHTFFMRGPIDVVLLDSDGRIMDIHHMKQRSFYSNQTPTVCVLELPLGHANDWRIGDMVRVTKRTSTV